MLVVGEKINILNPQVVKAVEEENIEAIKLLARSQLRAGADALDLNLGPSKKYARLLPKIVMEIQAEMDVPLFLSAPLTSLEKALSVHRGMATINAATCETETLARFMDIALAYQANLVVLLTAKEVRPITPEQKGMLAYHVLDTAARRGFMVDHLFLDPVLGGVFDPSAPELTIGAPFLDPVCETISIINRIWGEPIKTIAALGNATLGLQAANRSLRQQALLSGLMECGLSAVIVNPLDTALMDTLHSASLALY